MKKIEDKSKLGIICIVGFVSFLVIMFVYIQTSYSHKMKSLDIKISSGPVAPEYQKTQEIYLDKDGCTITTYKVQANETKVDDCQIQSGKFKEIQKDISTYGVIDKIIANKSTQSNKLIGGKNYTITLTLNNGDTFSTQSNTDFTDSIQPLINNMNLYIPQFSTLGI